MIKWLTCALGFHLMKKRTTAFYASETHHTYRCAKCGRWARQVSPRRTKRKGL